MVAPRMDFDLNIGLHPLVEGLNGTHHERVSHRFQLRAPRRYQSRAQLMLVFIAVRTISLTMHHSARSSTSHPGARSCSPPMSPTMAVTLTTVVLVWYLLQALW